MRTLLYSSILLSILVSSCAPNKVLFVTKTSLSILDIDTKPVDASIAYNRVEGYFGPSYDNGAVPPVFASIQSDGKIFNPEVKQLYATGDAAVIASGENLTKETVDLSGDKRFMFFGTSTTTGLKIGFTNKIPDSFIFGFKRKEASFIPIGTYFKLDSNGRQIKNKQGLSIVVDRYPSVIASIDTAATSGLDSSGKPIPAALKNHQFFATGNAAESLAYELRSTFQERAKGAFEVYRESVNRQKLIAGSLVTCYQGVRVADRPTIWMEAHKFGLFHDDNDKTKTIDKLLSWYNEVVDVNGVVNDPDRLARIDRVYVSLINIADGFNSAREKLLEIHEKTVCEFSKSNKP